MRDYCLYHKRGGGAKIQNVIGEQAGYELERSSLWRVHHELSSVGWRPSGTLHLARRSASFWTRGAAPPDGRYPCLGRRRTGALVTPCSAPLLSPTPPPTPHPVGQPTLTAIVPSPCGSTRDEGSLDGWQIETV